MKFQGSNLDEYRVDLLINKLYHLQNMDSTSIMSNTTKAIEDFFWKIMFWYAFQ